MSNIIQFPKRKRKRKPDSSIPIIAIVGAIMLWAWLETA